MANLQMSPPFEPILECGGYSRRWGSCRVHKLWVELRGYFGMETEEGFKKQWSQHHAGEQQALYFRTGISHSEQCLICQLGTRYI